MSFLIIDLEGAELQQEEKVLLQHPAVAGVILFARNYESHDQLRALTASISSTHNRACILVDQEGGRVQRFRDEFSALPSMKYWGAMYQKDPKAAKKQLQQMTKTMVSELKSVGVHATLAPVLDVDLGVSEIIGERSFGSDPDLVTKVAEIVIDAMHAEGMPVTGKHYPGHGGVALDSHKTLPIDRREKHDIIESDLLPFKHLSRKLDAIMPAHVVYETFDDKPAGFSPFWLQEILRHQLQFQGVIISDDLAMKGAASLGDYTIRSQQALEAGCDLILVCNDRPGVEMVLDTVGHYKNAMSQQRVETFIRKIM